jgi:hypothetical protein
VNINLLEIVRKDTVRCLARLIPVLLLCQSIAIVHASQPKLEWRSLNATPNDQSCKAVLFEQPRAIAIDRQGNIYLTNEKGVNALQKISVDGGTIVTLLDRGAESMKGKAYVGLSLALDRTGGIILGVGGRGTIEQVGKDGALKVLAGQPGKKGIVNGPVDRAQFKAIAAVAVGPHGDIYIAGMVTTLAGDERAKADYRDGQGSAAAFGIPKGLVVDDAGNVFVADGSYRKGEGTRYSSFGLVRKVDQTGLVRSIAGSIDSEGGYLDDKGENAIFTELFGIAMDAGRNLFVTEGEDEIRFAIREISATLEVTTILNAGSLADFEKDRDGSDPALYKPTGIALDASGTPHIVDTGGNKIHRIDKQAQITQVDPQRYSDAYVTTLCAHASLDSAR